MIRTHPENNWGYLAPTAELLPEVLQRAGYDTAMVGKWHLGLEAPNLPNQRGFQFFHGFLGDMMDDYYHHRRHDINYMRKNDQTIEPEGHATDLFSEWSCEYLKTRASSKRPFFLYLAYNAPHTPIQPPREWLEKVRLRYPKMSERRAKLVALIEHMDAGIGRVLSVLQETGLSERTCVVFTSDNGGQISAGANNGPLRDGKQSMYEGGLKVPTAVAWPGHIKAGTQTAQIGLTMDLFPTLCEFANAPIRHAIEGVSLRSVLLQEGAPPAARDLFFHRREGGERYGGLTIQALRRGPWKLLQNSPFAPLELYHLDDDPLEKNDLAAKNPGKFRELSAALRKQIQRGGAVPWQKPASRK